MKTIGMLGGMSWESTLSYYRALNLGVQRSLGGLHSAKILLHSVDFAQIEVLQSEGRWEEAASILGDAAVGLETAGADFLLICTNTMHKVAPQIQARIGMPILHIADATANVLSKDGVKKVGLLGTRFTMEQDFYRERIQAQGIEVIVPERNARDLVHKVIFAELCLGQINADSKARFLNIVDVLVAAGAEAVILGCTEIALLIQQKDSNTPLYDTTAIHAQQAVLLALSEVGQPVPA